MDFVFDIEDSIRGCPYQEETYCEYDTGYREYGCSLLNKDARDSCVGGYLDAGCPLSFKYRVEET